jgi:hypothetical protein
MGCHTSGAAGSGQHRLKWRRFSPALTQTPEERELAELYTALIEAYEDQHYAVPHALRINSWPL